MFNNMRVVANIDVVGLFLCPTTNEDLCPLLAILSGQSPYVDRRWSIRLPHYVFVWITGKPDVIIKKRSVNVTLSFYKKG